MTGVNLENPKASGEVAKAGRLNAGGEVLKEVTAGRLLGSLNADGEVAKNGSLWSAIDLVVGGVVALGG